MLCKPNRTESEDEKQNVNERNQQTAGWLIFKYLPRFLGKFVQAHMHSLWFVLYIMFDVYTRVDDGSAGGQCVNLPKDYAAV